MAKLDEVKVEGKKLGEEDVVKAESLNSLRKAHVEQLAKNQEEKSQGLHAMSEEICELRTLYGELKSSFHRKDLLFNQISSANGKLEAECNEKLLKSEGEKRDLVSSLDEAFARIHGLEKKTASTSEEISGLKRLLSSRQQLSLEMQKNASMVLKEGDEYIFKLEEESRVNRDELKWKKEQFSHLEEVHEKLQALFKESKSEWQKEKSSLLDEISSLQATLDAQIRASDSLEEELTRYKAMLDESEQCRSQLQQLIELENTLAENIKFAEEKVNFELQSKTSEIEILKLKLQTSESEVEILKLNLQENQQAYEQEKTSLPVTVNDKDTKIGNLEQQISMLKSVILAKSEADEMLNQEKDNSIRLAEDSNCSIKNPQNEIAPLRNKLAEREVTDIAISDANVSLRQENVSSIKERDQKKQEFQKENQDIKSAMISLAEEEYVFDEAECQKTLEVVEEKNGSAANLEKEMNRLHEKVELQEKSLLQSIDVSLQPKETKKPEIQELRNQLEKETRCFENLLEELESHKHALLEDRTKQKINREMLAQFESMCQLIGFLCTEDAELMGMLGKLSPLYEEDSEPARNLLSSDTFSPSRKSVQVSLDERTPLSELNV